MTMMMEKRVSQHYRRYLEREHERLEKAIEEQTRSRSDQLEIARLKKMKLAVRDQLNELASQDQQAA